MVGVFGESVLSAIENRRLVHVQPDVEDVSGPFEGGVVVETSPVLPGARINEVNPCALSGPAVPVHDLVVPIFHEYIHELFPDPLLVHIEAVPEDVVVVVLLDVGVCDDHQLPGALVNCLDHVSHIVIVELVPVKCKVTIPICVGNIHPEYIHWEPVLLKLLIPLQHPVC
jgi:hypothetical protein